MHLQYYTYVYIFIINTIRCFNISIRIYIVVYVNNKAKTIKFVSFTQHKVHYTLEDKSKNNHEKNVNSDYAYGLHGMDPIDCLEVKVEKRHVKYNF